MRNIIAAIWGIEGSGKTTMALTFPKPLKHYDLDVGGYDRAAWRLSTDGVDSQSYAIPVQIEKLMGAQKQGISIRFPRRVIGYKEVWQKIVTDFVADCQNEKLQTIVIDSATQLWTICLHPDTRILHTDLTWRPIGNTKIGDSLIGFSEYAELIGDRVLKKSIVESTSRRNSSAYRITFDNNLSIVASPEHPWLRVSSKREWDANSERGFLPKERWYRTDQLQVGDKLRFICEPWLTDTSYAAGYLAGLYDGEGCVDSPKALSLSQKSEIVVDTLLSTLASRGFESRVYEKSQEGGYSVRIHGKDEMLRFLGSIRPPRLLPRAVELWNYKVVQGDRHTITVVSVESVADTELIDIKTSTGTFIAEGVFSHNCHTSLLQEKQEIQLASGTKAEDKNFREKLLPVEFPNDRMRSLIYTARSYKKNLVLTHYPRNIYKQKFDSKGELVEYKSDDLEPDGFKDTTKLVDIVFWAYADKNVARAKITLKCGVEGLGMTAVGLELPTASYGGMIELQKAMAGE
jgi:hypothetical protein